MADDEASKIDEASMETSSVGKKDESFQKITRRKRKKDDEEEMDTSLATKRPSFPPLAAENTTVCLRTL